MFNKTKTKDNLNAVMLRLTRENSCKLAQQIALTKCLQRTETFLRT